MVKCAQVMYLGMDDVETDGGPELDEALIKVTGKSASPFRCS